VVEDEAPLLTLLRYNLEKQGFRVEEAADGQEALTYCRAHRPDVILLDWNMPVMNGLDATRAIRAQEAPGRHVPIVAMTANVDQGAIERCLQAGMDAFMPKPIRLQELNRIVGDWLPARRAASPRGR
jgi:two-component system phosphate regulon response regulator PhoB